MAGKSKKIGYTTQPEAEPTMTQEANISNLSVNEIKTISDEIVEILIEKAKTRKVYVLNFILDQAKKNIEIANQLKHDPRDWQSDRQSGEC